MATEMTGGALMRKRTVRCSFSIVAIISPARPRVSLCSVGVCWLRGNGVLACNGPLIAEPRWLRIAGESAQDAQT